MTALLATVDPTDIPPELHWSDDSEPGLRRVRRGKGFSYVEPGGRACRDEKTLQRVRALAVPPAWTDVWICPSPNGHLQATGRDARGRKQYRYHARFRAHRELVKFDRLLEFGEALPDLRRRVAQDLALGGIPKDKVMATVVRLLESTLVRVGNEEYARTNGSYGLTTLREKHCRVTSDGVRLVFKGKHGVARDIRVQDRRLRHVVKQCQDLPGQQLFQFLDDEGEARPISSTDVNAYLREVTGADTSAKDFRTWMATVLATSALAELSPPRTQRNAQQQVARVVESVADQLGNTPSVCRASYVHPTVIDWYSDGTLSDRWDQCSARGSRLLVADERKLCALLRSMRRRRVRRAA
jgi:DNA topoisomerase-1